MTQDSHNVSLPKGYGSFYNRHKIKIISLCVGVVTVFCLFQSRQDTMESSRPFVENPLLTMRSLGLYFFIGLLLILGWILIGKLIDHAGLSDDLSTPPW